MGENSELLTRRFRSSKPSICLLTAFNHAYEPIASVTIPRMQALADRHDYNLQVIKRDDCERRGGWLKIGPIRDALEEAFDYVLWLDIDTVVLRRELDVRASIQEGAELHMAWHGPDTSRIDGGGFEPHYNSGVMLIRCSDWSKRFFSNVWEVGQLNHVWTDQAAILHNLGYDEILSLGPNNPDEPNRGQVARLDCMWNSILGVAMSDDPVIHHYAGILDPEVRLRMILIDTKSALSRESASSELRSAFSWHLSQWRNDIVR